MRSYVLSSNTLRKGKGDAFDEFPSIHKDECGSMGLCVGSKLIEDLFPHNLRSNRRQLIAWDFDRNVHVALLPNLHNRRWLTMWAVSDQKFGYEFDRILRSRKSNSLWRIHQPRNECTWRKPVFSAYERIQAFKG